MFGFFMFGQPQFADVPFIRTPGGGGAGGGGRPSRKDRRKNILFRRQFEARLETILIGFLETQS